MTIPTHGPIACTDCSTLLKNRGADLWGGKGEQCQLENNPGSWGSETPTVLVLGFSKGPKQNEAWRQYKVGNLSFEDVPFHSRKSPGSHALTMRGRLDLLLKELGLLQSPIDSIFTSAERAFSSSSLVRCSLMVRDGNSYTEDLKKIVASATAGGTASQVIARCAKRYLSKLPACTLIVMLGLDKSYVKCAREVFAQMYDGVREIDDLCYTDESRTWVHVAHPSGRLTDPQFVAWVTGCTKANKIARVKDAIRGHLRRQEAQQGHAADAPQAARR